MINPEQPDFSNTPASSERPPYPYLSAALDRVPVVSIITPYFNTDESFIETARSLFNQSFHTWEWVIVDDGSNNPQALARLAAVADSDSRVRIIRQNNAGPSAARNTAFRESVGRYICLLDSDDMVEPTFIEKCIWFLESNNEFAFCNSWSVTFGDEEFLWQNGFERGKSHLTENSGPPISVIRRSAFVASGGFDESIRLGHEDWDFWLAMANAGQWGYTLPEYLEWYRKRKSGRFFEVMSSKGVHRQFERMIAKKYAGLDQRFPAPQRKRTEAFETVSSDLPFDNPCANTADDRRILFILPWMVTGGADRVNLDWIKLLKNNGYQISVCATLETHHNWWHEFTKLTPDVFILPNFLSLIDFPRFLLYLIHSRQISVVLMTGSTLGYQLLPFLRSSCPGVTFVDLCHVEEPHWLSGGHPRFGVGYHEMLDLNIVTTAHLREWMASRGGDRNRIEVCYSGIDFEGHQRSPATRSRIRARLGLPRGVTVVTFAGRLCDQKRPLFVAEILRKLAQRKIAFRALLIGDGELRSAVENLVDRYELRPWVHFLGTIDHEKWIDALSVSDIFLLPSQYEGISVALLEAMGLGVVPVVAAVGGQSEVITGAGGFIIAHGPKEIDDYATAIAKIARNRKVCQIMGKAAARRVHEHFSRRVTADRLLYAIDKAQQLSRSSPRPLQMTRHFALELATFAIEYARLNRVADTLWAQSMTSAQTLAAERENISSLEVYKRWLGEQNRQLEEIAANRAAIIAEKEAWIAKLEEAKQWWIGQSQRLDGALAEQARHNLALQGQLQSTTAQISQQQAWIERLLGSRRWRLLSALRMTAKLKPPLSSGSTAPKEPRTD